MAIDLHLTASKSDAVVSLVGLVGGEAESLLLPPCILSPGSSAGMLPLCSPHPSQEKAPALVRKVVFPQFSLSANWFGRSLFCEPLWQSSAASEIRANSRRELRISADRIVCCSRGNRIALDTIFCHVFLPHSLPHNIWLIWKVWGKNPKKKWVYNQCIIRAL